MTQPFDELYPKPQFKPGSFHCDEGKRLEVTLQSISDFEAHTIIGDGGGFTVQKDTAQVLSDYFGQIAKQLRSRKV
jgi:hypothetical protein